VVCAEEVLGAYVRRRLTEQQAFCAPDHRLLVQEFPGIARAARRYREVIGGAFEQRTEAVSFTIDNDGIRAARSMNTPGSAGSL
jgi:hypothetical protein